MLDIEAIESFVRQVLSLTAAPTDTKLGALQPSSVISLSYIANNITPTADYATIANLAPSVSNVETNGPGLSEAKHTTLRGFDDNSYNVTYDGIPFGDINDFSHHTTSYFPAKMIGRMDTERGPGTASDIGYATFGGTMALYSKDPRRDAAIIPTASYGSFSTQLEHLEFNTGTLAQLNGASAIGAFQYINTAGYRTNADMWRRTYYTKVLQPLGKGVSLTFLGTYNDIKFNNPSTVTQAQINTLGRNYGLGTRIGEEGPKPGFEQPLRHWSPTSLAPSGLAFVTSERYPGWKGSLLMGTLRGQVLVRLTLEGDRVVSEQRLLEDLKQRIRDVRQGPDGWIYVLTDGDAARLLRLQPG
jgi:hypothetical protein